MIKINWESISFKIISEAGAAKSEAMEAISAAREKNFELANKKMERANQHMTEASHKHFGVIQEEAKGVQLDFKVLFMHAEDQLMTTQNLLLIATEVIELHNRLSKLDDE